MICFSLTGQETGEKLCRGLKSAGITATLDKKSKYLPDSIQISTSAWAGEKFPDSDALIFIGASGIAVRSIAPYVVSKKSDPAVLVVDECGKFVISLLSGHLGGANELALKTAEILNAVPVVTTATDLHHRFAVDVFAKKNDCSIFNMKAAKEVSAAFLAGKKVGFYSEFPVDGRLPEGLIMCDERGIPVRNMEGMQSDTTESPESKKMISENAESIVGKLDDSGIDCGAAVTVHTSCQPFASTTQIVPGNLTLGMGCRKGKDAEGIAISMPGMIDSDKGYCRTGGMLVYNQDKYAAHQISELCRCPVHIDNDGKCAAWAEYTVGSLAGCQNAAAFIIGTGVGGGLIIDGKLVRGKHFSAGEFSFVGRSLNEWGTLKGFVGHSDATTGLLELMREAKQIPAEEPLDGRKAFEWINAGDPVACEVLDRFTYSIAFEIFNLQMLLDIERIAIGGGISGQDILLTNIQKNYRKLILEDAYYEMKGLVEPNCEIVKCKYGNEANQIGAFQSYLTWKEAKHYE